MYTWARRATVTAVFTAAGVVLTLALNRCASKPPAPAADVPPMGWTVVCIPAAIGDVCRTYPPGDRRWDSAPIPPWRPLVLPSGAGNGQSLTASPPPRP